MKLRVQVKANQRQDQIWWDGEQLICRVTAVPKSGESNRYLVGYLANRLGLAKSQVKLEKGFTSGFKIFDLAASESDINQALSQLPRVAVQSKLEL